MYICIYVYMYVCMYACMHACMHVCMYVYIYIYTFVCMFVCMYECMYVFVQHVLGWPLLHECEHLHHTFTFKPCLTERSAASFLTPGKMSQAGCALTPVPGRLKPYGMAVYGLPRRPIQESVFSRDKTSTGLNWLGTLSNHIWHMDFSSTRKSWARRWLLLELLDQVFRKAPRTDSLSINPPLGGIQRLGTTSSANISSSCIRVTWPSERISAMSIGLTSSLKKNKALPWLSYNAPPTPA